MIGTNAFQEIPLIEVTRSITNHNYQIMDVDDIPRIVREAFFLVRLGLPRPVLIDIPKDVQQQMVILNWDQPMKLPGYMYRPTQPPKKMLDQIVRLITDSKKTVLYVGGGCAQSSKELRRFVVLTGIYNIF